MKRLVMGILVCIVAAAATELRAALINPSWTRPASDGQAAGDLTTYQRWNVFTTTTGPNAPDVAEINPIGVANAYDAANATSGSFVTSGGNIYSFAAVINPVAVVPGYGVGQPTDFLVQLITQGSEIDVNDLTLDGTLVSTLSNYSYTELSRVSLGGFGGFAIEHAWTFTAPVDLSSFQLDWGWGVSSSSLDVMSVDTHTAIVPEPASCGLALVGGLGVCLALVAWRRRRG
ncbi:MAG: hypothetical protein AB7O59_02635 [Pirellulales bacterium]